MRKTIERVAYVLLGAFMAWLGIGLTLRSVCKRAGFTWRELLQRIDLREGHGVRIVGLIGEGGDAEGDESISLSMN